MFAKEERKRSTKNYIVRRHFVTAAGGSSLASFISLCSMGVTDRPTDRQITHSKKPEKKKQNRKESSKINNIGGTLMFRDEQM